MTKKVEKNNSNLGWIIDFGIKSVASFVTNPIVIMMLLNEFVEVAYGGNCILFNSAEQLREELPKRSYIGMGSFFCGNSNAEYVLTIKNNAICAICWGTTSI